MRLAIVIPTLNEEESLRQCLPAVFAAVREAAEVRAEMVVADGGSTDGTVAAAREIGARVVTGPPGRGLQLNRGAAVALAGDTPADVLLFLHADTTLPPGAVAKIRRAVENGAEGGAFYLRFDVDRPLQRLGSRLINLRTRWLRVPLGDQAQFVTREAFARLGGFQDWPILEDFDFILRLRKSPRMVLIDGEVTTGARRFVEQGTVRTVATNWLIWLLFLLGVSPHRLARLYRHIR